MRGASACEGVDQSWGCSSTSCHCHKYLERTVEKEERLTVSELQFRMRWGHSFGPEVRENIRAVEPSSQEAEGECVH